MHTTLRILSFTVILLLAAAPARADDVKVTPAPGDGLVITNSTGTSARLRVNENGEVFLPGLPLHPSADRAICRDQATGSMGTCALVTPGPQGPPGNVGPQGPTGPPGVPGPNNGELVCASNSVEELCMNGSPCPQDFILDATCPPGYNRSGLVSCTKPTSINLVATEHRDPFIPNKIGCRYVGFVEPFSSENLTVHITCRRQVCIF